MSNRGTGCLESPALLGVTSTSLRRKPEENVVGEGAWARLSLRARLLGFRGRPDGVHERRGVRREAVVVRWDVGGCHLHSVTHIDDCELRTCASTNSMRAVPAVQDRLCPALRPGL